MTTVEANTSIIELSPKATKASDLAARPRPMVTKTSIRFHPVVAHSRRMPRRCKRSWSVCVIVIGPFRLPDRGTPGWLPSTGQTCALVEGLARLARPGSLTGDRSVPACR